MENPSTLTAKQDVQDRSGRRAECTVGQGKPTLTHEEYGEYTFEAHHIVSGNQILKGHIMARRISKTVSGSYIKNDTGYSINKLGKRGVAALDSEETHA